MGVRHVLKRMLWSAAIPGMVAGAMLVYVSHSSAQQPAPGQKEQDKWVSPNPDLSGFWEPKYTGEGSGAFSDVFGKVPKAELVPGRKPAGRPVAASYAYGLARNHSFVDGNKRVAFMAMTVFLRLNGIAFRPEQAHATAMFVALAAGEIEEAGLARWIRDNWPAP